MLPIFRLEINDPAKTEALISQNLVYQVTGIVYKVEEIRQPVSVTQCFNCQSFGHSAKNCRSNKKCLICGEGHSHKGCPNKEAKKPKCANCKGPHVASYKGCPDILFHSRTASKIRSKRGHTNSPATGLLP